MEQIRILLVDDDAEFRQALKVFFSTSEDYKVVSVDSGRQALCCMDKEPFDVVITDMAMPDLNGLETMRHLQRLDPSLPVIIITGVGTIDNAVESIHGGAFHYTTKPFDPEELEALVLKAAEAGRMNRRLLDKKEQVDEESDFIVGYSPKVMKIMEIVDRVAGTDDATVLIMGETGTGKSLLAKRIHAKSSRSHKAFMTIDCAALSETLLESELFGHVKGAFTGATSNKIGLLQQARGGTVFLDEIGELSPGMQMKLLSAVQDRMVKPLGGNERASIDVRFLSATSRDLKEDLKTGRFRKDLFFRLAVIQLQLPPLRQRTTDIMLFLDHFIRKFNKQYGKEISGIQPGAVHMLLSAPWPGNIRELENATKRAVLLSTGDVLSAADICPDLYQEFETEMEDGQVLLKDVIHEAEKMAIIKTLQLTDGNKSLTAKMLGISRPTLYEKLAAYGLK